jgi:hypothetical protein
MCDSIRPLKINYILMKKYIIVLFILAGFFSVSFGQNNLDQLTGNCIKNAGEEAKYLKDFRVQLGKGTADCDFRYKAKLSLWKETRYRFTLCTADNSKGKLILNIRDEADKLILASSDDNKPGEVNPSIDFVCSKSGTYQICFDFSDRLPGSGIGVVSILK